MDDKTKLITDLLADSELLTVKEVANVNPKPHTYIIGPGHVRYASDHYMGMLGAGAIRGYEKQGGHCAHPQCRIPYDQHTSDVVLFISLKRHCTGDELRAEFTRTKLQEVMKEAGIHGLAFVDTPEVYRITEEGATNG